MSDGPDVAEFRRFHELLTTGRPNYHPHYFPLAKGQKNPQKGRSWKKCPVNSYEAEQWMRAGHNIGIAARGKPFKTDNAGNIVLDAKGDPVTDETKPNLDGLVIIDQDDARITDFKEPTLKIRSRKRTGFHRFYWTDDETAKVTIPTDKKGEVRAAWSYVVAPGSFIPTTAESLEKEGNATPSNDQLPFLGKYTIESPVPMATITFDEFPQIFRDQATKADSAKPKMKHARRERSPDEPTSALWVLKIEDVVGDIHSAGERFPSLFHDSTTGQNTSITRSSAEGPGLLQCWRHGVSLTPFQALAVLAGLGDCVDIGEAHKNSKAGPSTLEYTQENIEVLWSHAKKMKIIPEEDLHPFGEKGKQNDVFQDGLFKITVASASLTKDKNVKANIKLYHDGRRVDAGNINFSSHELRKRFLKGLPKDVQDQCEKFIMDVGEQLEKSLQSAAKARALMYDEAMKEADLPSPEQPFISVDDQKKADSMDLKAAVEQMKLLEDFKEPSSYVNQLLHAAHTHLIDLFDVTYYLGFFGPRGSGKSRATANTIFLSRSGIMFTDATEAALAAMLDECHTLGFDELDVLLAANKATVLPSVVRSGYNRSTGARYLREKTGDEDEPWVTVKQNLFGPKAFNFMLSVDPATMARTQLIMTYPTEDKEIPRRSLFSQDYLVPVKLWLEKEVTRCREGWTRQRVKELILSDEFGQELEACSPGLPRNREIGAIVLATAKIMKWDATAVLRSLFIGTTLLDEASVEFAITEYLVGRWDSKYPIGEETPTTPMPISTIVLVEKLNDARRKQGLKSFGIKTVNAGLQALGVVKKGTDNRLPRGVFDETNPPADPKKEGRVRGFYLPPEKVEALRISLSCAVPGVPAVPEGGASSSGTGEKPENLHLSRPVPQQQLSIEASLNADVGTGGDRSQNRPVPASQYPLGTAGTAGTGDMRGIEEGISLALKLHAQGCTLEEIAKKVSSTVIKHCQERGMLPIIEPSIDSKKATSPTEQSEHPSDDGDNSNEIADREEERLKRVVGSSWSFVSGLIDDCAEAMRLDEAKNWGAFQIRAYAQRFQPTPSTTIVDMFANDEAGYQKTVKLIANNRNVHCQGRDGEDR